MITPMHTAGRVRVGAILELNQVDGVLLWDRMYGSVWCFVLSVPAGVCRIRYVLKDHGWHTYCMW